MLHTSARLLRLLTLLTARPSWTCAELAEQLAITDRTVRRDVARLRELGYGIESDPGPFGGYRLGRGSRVPPLILDDEEALAVAVGLRTAALAGVSGCAEAALSALLKLRHVLPAKIADRLGELDAAVTHTTLFEGPHISAELLLSLATVCRAGERVRLSYRDGRGTDTVREVDPYRLAYTGRRWYFVARDVRGQDWRTFRGDRVLAVDTTGQPVAATEPPDLNALIRYGVVERRYPMHVRARLPLPLAEALRKVPATVGTHTPDGPDATVVDVGGPDADGLARYLLGLGTPLTVLDPPEVRDALRRRVQQLLTDNPSVPQ